MSGDMSAAGAASVLVVDDTPANLQVLTAMLKEDGFRVRPVTSGRQALRAARSAPPDLILLDIMMPDMDGYRVCDLLKQDARLRDIPVIFISALNETMDKVRALEAGGVDYITKPFQFQEVRARVGAHLRLRRLQVDLEQRNRELRDSYEQLRELETLRDGLTHMIVHDLRSPLTGVLAGLRVLDRGGALTEQQQHIVDMSAEAAGRLLGMIDDLLDVNRMESGQLELRPSALDPAALAQGCIRLMDPLARDKQLDLRLEIDGTPPTLQADANLVQRALVNLLDNAIRFTTQGMVTLSVHHDMADGEMHFTVRDTGEGIPEDGIARIFEKFGQVASREVGRVTSTGLGLTFCRMVAEAHGGRIWVESTPGLGSVFVLAVPLAPTSAS